MKIKNDNFFVFRGGADLTKERDIKGNRLSDIAYWLQYFIL